MKNQPNAVGAIGHVDLHPNSRNIIPGRVVCTVDMRTHLVDKLNAMVAEFELRAPAVCKEIGVGFECHIVGQFDPPAFDEDCVAMVRNAARELGYSHMDLVSGAGTRRLLDKRRRADGHDYVPVRRRAQPQRGRRDNKALGTRRHRRAHARGA